MLRKDSALCLKSLCFFLYLLFFLLFGWYMCQREDTFKFNRVCAANRIQRWVWAHGVGRFAGVRRIVELARPQLRFLFFLYCFCVAFIQVVYLQKDAPIGRHMYCYIHRNI